MEDGLKEEISSMKENLNKQLQDSIQEATKDLWRRIYEVIKHASEKLHDSEAIFRNSLIGNIIELVNLLPKLNLNNDAELDQMRKELEVSICQIDPQTLRENTKERKVTAKLADDLLQKVENFYTLTPL